MIQSTQENGFVESKGFRKTASRNLFDFFTSSDFLQLRGWLKLFGLRRIVFVQEESHAKL